MNIVNVLRNGYNVLMCESGTLCILAESENLCQNKDILCMSVLRLSEGKGGFKSR
jgi:hypothetical protein